MTNDSENLSTFAEHRRSNEATRKLLLCLLGRQDVHSFVKILFEMLPVFTAAFRVFSAQEKQDEKSQARKRSQICAADSHRSFAVAVQSAGEQKTQTMYWHLENNGGKKNHSSDAAGSLAEKDGS